MRRPRPGVLIGGAPLRVLRLTGAGARLVDGWEAGAPVGPGRGAGVLAARLTDAGIAEPVPPSEPHRTARVAVVVPVRDDQTGLGQTLAALAETTPGVPVTVVDDGSARPAVTPPGVEVVRRAAPGGPAAARNTGAAAALGGGGGPEVIVFVDAGVVPGSGWLPSLLAHMADPAVAAVAPRVTSRPHPEAGRSLVAYEAVRSPLDLGRRPAPVRPGSAVSYVPTALLAVRVGAWERSGGFDEAMRFGEDVDLVWRLAASGWRVRYEPAAVASHPCRAGVARWARQRYDYGRSATRLSARHGRAAAPLTVQPWSVASWALLASGHPLAAAAVAGGTAAALARRAGGDRAVRKALVHLALAGTARAGGPIGAAVRRAWLPPAAAVAAVAWRAGDRRGRWWLAGSAVSAALVPGLAEWARRRPGPGPLTWVGLRLADDLAYQAGVWAGCVESRSAGALLPRW